MRSYKLRKNNKTLFYFKFKNLQLIFLTFKNLLAFSTFKIGKSKQIGNKIKHFEKVFSQPINFCHVRNFVNNLTYCLFGKRLFMNSFYKFF